MLVKEFQILAEALWHSVKDDLVFFSSISSFSKKLAEYDYNSLDKQNLKEVEIYVDNIQLFFAKYRKTETGVIGRSLYIPPKQTSSNDTTVRKIISITSQLRSMSEDELANEVEKLKPKIISNKKIRPLKVFIGHGRSKLWARVQLFLKDDLELDSFSFESESHTSKTIVQILDDFLANSGFAILILTAEDETSDGTLRARQNVIHECGLFQGRLGFDNVVLLKQNNAENLSNLAGLQYIPFENDNIEQTFYELQRKLKKSGLLK